MGVDGSGLNGSIFAATFDEIINAYLFNPKMISLFWQSEQIAPMILLNGTQTNYHCDPPKTDAVAGLTSRRLGPRLSRRILGGGAIGRTFDFAPHFPMFEERDGFNRAVIDFIELYKN